jgi:hypothetical protein
MATYAELRNVFHDDELRHKLEVAVIVAADTIRTESPATENHANRLAWAKGAFGDPSSAAVEMLKALIAANKDATIASITGATDAQIQAKVDAAVDIFADGS